MSRFILELLDTGGFKHFKGAKQQQISHRAQAAVIIGNRSTRSRIRDHSTGLLQIVKKSKFIQPKG